MIDRRIVLSIAPLLIVTQAGQAVRFVPDDVRPMGRDTRGVRGMDLPENQSVIAMLVAALWNWRLPNPSGGRYIASGAEIPSSSRALASWCLSTWETMSKEGMAGLRGKREAYRERCVPAACGTGRAFGAAGRLSGSVDLTEEQRTIMTETATRPDGTPLRALVVDDEVNIAELLAMALRYEGWSVETAHTGSEAVSGTAHGSAPLAR